MKMIIVSVFALILAGAILLLWDNDFTVEAPEEGAMVSSTPPALGADGKPEGFRGPTGPPQIIGPKGPPPY